MLPAQPAPQAYLATSEEFWIAQLEGRGAVGIQWAEMKDAADVLQCTGQCSAAKNDPSRNICSAMLRNPLVGTSNIAMKSTEKNFSYHETYILVVGEKQ